MAKGGYRGVKWGAYILPPAIFKNAFDIYNFSAISNLFDSNKPYAISTHNRKCIIFVEALRIRVKKFKQNLPENYSKSTKIAISACKFSKIFRGSMPPDPPIAFVSQSASNLFCRKKIRLKKCGNCGSPFKISRYATVCTKTAREWRIVQGVREWFFLAEGVRALKRIGNHCSKWSFSVCLQSTPLSRNSFNKSTWWYFEVCGQ